MQRSEVFGYLQPDTRVLWQFGLRWVFHLYIGREQFGAAILRMTMDDAFTPDAIAKRRRKPFGSLEVDDQTMLVKAPVDVSDQGNSDIVEPHLDTVLVGARHTVLAKFRQAVFDIACDLVPLTLAPGIGGDRAEEWQGRVGDLLEKARQLLPPTIMDCAF